MHESGVVKSLVNQLLQTAHASGARRVTRANIWLGALSQFSATHFREHFEEESRGTLAQDTELEIEESIDPFDSSAQHVVIRSVDLEVLE